MRTAAANDDGTAVVDLRADRERRTKLIVESRAPKKLISAGPGTGKTTTFKRALAVCGGRGLALTFINSLVADLEDRLADVADVFTFHGFCKYLLHRINVTGLTKGFEYYPPLFILLSEDLKITGPSQCTPEEIEHLFHRMDDSGGVISTTLKLGSYYDSVGHSDSVFRVQQHFHNCHAAVPAYPLIVVDEYQDFNRLEVEFIRLLSAKSPVLIVGDDDQALYAFKDADPRFIRELAGSSEFEKFELPYCSRCTEVIVNAVEDVLRCAKARGWLAGRIPKPFTWFPPDKQEDSKRHPHIIHADCTVERKNAPLMGRYVAEQIRQIPQKDIEQAYEDGEPSALVIGPSQFVSLVHREVQKEFGDAEIKKSDKLVVDCVHGYGMLARNPESRLGWRIILHCFSPDKIPEVVKNYVVAGRDFIPSLPADFRRKHLSTVALIGRLAQNEDLSAQDERKVLAATGHSMQEIQKLLGAAEEPEHSRDPSSPHIVCTTLLGAKGLAAPHVFMVGMNNGHLPRKAAAIMDDEIRQFIVGLTRTRKQCHVVSCRRFGADTTAPSVFLNWIAKRLFHQFIDAAHFK